MGDNIEKDIISIVADISGFDETDITRDTNFVKDLEIDSIKTIEITVAIEKKYKISVRDEEVPKITTVMHAVDTVQRLLSQRTANAR